MTCARAAVRAGPGEAVRIGRARAVARRGRAPRPRAAAARRGCAPRQSGSQSQRRTSLANSSGVRLVSFLALGAASSAGAAGADLPPLTGFCASAAAAGSAAAACAAALALYAATWRAVTQRGAT
jgi:hypothetical protein